MQASKVERDVRRMKKNDFTSERRFCAYETVRGYGIVSQWMGICFCFSRFVSFTSFVCLFVVYETNCVQITNAYPCVGIICC